MTYRTLGVRPASEPDNRAFAIVIGARLSVIVLLPLAYLFGWAILVVLALMVAAFTGGLLAHPHLLPHLPARITHFLTGDPR